MSRTKIAVGDVFTDDDGTELTVIEIDKAEDEVVFEDEDGHEGVMSLKDMLDALRSGELDRTDTAEDDAE